jgi:hypothetical protein
MKIVDIFRIGIAVCLMAVPASPSRARGVSDPAPIVSAFNETCRRGFPDLETISQRAQSQGWIRASFRMIAHGRSRKLRSAALPHFLQKGGMILILSAPYKRWTTSSCLISVPAEETLDTRGLAAAVSIALGGAPATVAKSRGGERMTWHVGSGMVVQASVTESGGTRIANLAVLTG